MDLDDLYRLLRGAHVQAQGVLDTIRDPLLVLDKVLCIQSANPAFYRTFATSRDATLGTSFLHLGDGQWNDPDLEFLLHKVIPKGAAIYDYEVTGEFPKIGRRTMLVTAQKLVHPDDGRQLLLLNIHDATDQRAQESAKDMRISEVRHRLKNLLAVTQALAKQTSVEGRSAEEYRDIFLGRIGALARALDVSMDDRPSELPELANAVLAPYIGEGRMIRIDNGPVVPLQSRRAMSLGMIFHELATNAVKYGALSTASGRVAVRWTIEGEANGSPKVHLTWNESDGPAVSPPAASGFGTRLITATAERDLGGSVGMDFRPDGLTATLCFPMG